MDEQELIERFTPVCEQQLAALSRTLEILASQRAVDLRIRQMRAVDAGELPESFRGPCVISRGEVGLGIIASEVVMVFHLTDVLIVVGLMYMMEEAEILGKLEQGYTDDDADAFGEASNQAFGGLASVLSEAYRGTGEVETRHLETIEADFSADPQALAAQLAEPRVLMVELELQIEGYDPSEALLFWPLSLVGALAEQSPRRPTTRHGGPRRTTRSADVNRALKLKLPLSVLLARKQMTMGEIMNISIGSVIEFEKSSEEYLDFMISDRKIGAGEAGKMGEKFCLQIKRIGTPQETLSKLS